MPTISICLIVHDYLATRYAFENSGFAIVEKEVEFIVKDAPKEYIKVIDGIEIQLLVAVNSQEAREYFYHITDVVEYKGNDADTYNYLFKQATGEYICIFNPCLLQKNWLVELIYYHTNVIKSGIISIPNTIDNMDFLPIPTDNYEKFINVFIPQNDIVEGIYFFPKQYLYYIGAFDVSLNINEITQFQARAIAMGLTNYYIPSQSCINTNSVALSVDEKVIESLNEMRKRNNYYLPL